MGTEEEADEMPHGGIFAHTQQYFITNMEAYRNVPHLSIHPCLTIYGDNHHPAGNNGLASSLLLWLLSEQTRWPLKYSVEALTLLAYNNIWDLM